MDSKEVRMHSAFIGELLNPSGSHGLNDIPLEIFINLFKEKFNAEDRINNFKIDSKSVNTFVEKHIGATNDDKTEGGRIDIIIEDKVKNAIIIENKIYAREQENQLIRYNNHLKEAPILYLTLFGDAPTSQGDLIENLHYFNISYKVDIKKWLEICLKEAVELPMLREVIKQYLYLIKKLTNQTTNEDMSAEIRNLINEENVELIVQINNEYRSIVNEIREKILRCVDYQIVLIHDCFIKVKITEDSDDGIYVGYQYFDNNRNSSSSEKAKEIRNIIVKSIEKKIDFNNNFIAWYNPIKFLKKEKIESVGNKEIIKMYKNPEYLDVFIKTIIDEENKIKTELEKLI
jgi:predicted nucleic acid-binding protein